MAISATLNCYRIQGERDMLSSALTDRVFYNGDTIEIPGIGFGSAPTFWFTGGVSGIVNINNAGTPTTIGQAPNNRNGFNFSNERPKTIQNDAWRGKYIHSVVWDGSDATADNGLTSHDRGVGSAVRSKIFRHWYSRVVCDAPQFQCKHMRDEPRNEIEDAGPEQLCMLWRKNSGRYILNRSSTVAGEAADRYDFSSAVANNFDLAGGQWFGVNHYRVVGDEGGSNGVCVIENWIKDNARSRNIFTGLTDIDSGVSDRPRYTQWQEYLGGYNEGNPTIGEVSMSDMYVQVAAENAPLVRAYLCSTPDLYTSVVHEIQEPVTTGWSDTLAKFRINSVALTPGIYYFKVVCDDSISMYTYRIKIGG